MIDWDGKMTCKFLGMLSGKDVDVVRRVLCGGDEWRYLPGSLMWLFDEGMIDEKEFFEVLRARLGIGSEIPHARMGEAFTRFFSGSRTVFGIMRFLQEVFVDGERMIQGIVSNNNSLMWRHTLSAFPALKLRDAGTGAGVMDFHSISYQLKVRKPARGIFARTLEAVSWYPYRQRTGYEIMPDECLFFDDMEENVRAAREFGIHAVLVDRGAESIIDGLKSFRVPISGYNYQESLRRSPKQVPPSFFEKDYVE